VSRSVLARGVAVLVLLGIAVAAYVVFRSDGGGKRSSSPLPTGELAVSAEANELSSLIRDGQERAYHARYEVKASDGKGQSVEIETWRREGLVRWDETIRAEERTVRTSSYRLKDRSVTCARRDDEAWKCQPLPAASPAPDPVIGGIAGELAGKSVAVEDERVAGRRVRCFEIRQSDEKAEVCLTPGGIPVVYRIESARLELVELDEGEDAVPGDVFEPPAG
jgi:hypothetical protein